MNHARGSVLPVGPDSAGFLVWFTCSLPLNLGTVPWRFPRFSRLGGGACIWSLQSGVLLLFKPNLLCPYLFLPKSRVPEMYCLWGSSAFFSLEQSPPGP